MSSLGFRVIPVQTHWAPGFLTHKDDLKHLGFFCIWIWVSYILFYDRGIENVKTGDFFSGFQASMY